MQIWHPNWKYINRLFFIQIAIQRMSIMSDYKHLRIYNASLYYRSYKIRKTWRRIQSNSERQNRTQQTAQIVPSEHSKPHKLQRYAECFKTQITFSGREFSKSC